MIRSHIGRYQCANTLAYKRVLRLSAFFFVGIMRVCLGDSFLPASRKCIKMMVPKFKPQASRDLTDKKGKSKSQSKSTAGKSAMQSFRALFSSFATAFNSAYWNAARATIPRNVAFLSYVFGDSTHVVDVSCKGSASSQTFAYGSFDCLMCRSSRMRLAL